MRSALDFVWYPIKLGEWSTNLKALYCCAFLSVGFGLGRCRIVERPIGVFRLGFVPVRLHLPQLKLCELSRRPDLDADSSIPCTVKYRILIRLIGSKENRWFRCTFAKCNVISNEGLAAKRKGKWSFETDSSAMKVCMGSNTYSREIVNSVEEILTVRTKLWPEIREVSFPGVSRRSPVSVDLDAAEANSHRPN